MQWQIDIFLSHCRFFSTETPERLLIRQISPCYLKYITIQCHDWTSIWRPSHFFMLGGRLFVRSDTNTTQIQVMSKLHLFCWLNVQNVKTNPRKNSEDFRGVHVWRTSILKYVLRALYQVDTCCVATPSNILLLLFDKIHQVHNGILK